MSRGVHVDLKQVKECVSGLHAFAVVNKRQGRKRVGTETLEQAKQANAGFLQAGWEGCGGRVLQEKMHSAAEKKTC